MKSNLLYGCSIFIVGSIVLGDATVRGTAGGLPEIHSKSDDLKTYFNTPIRVLLGRRIPTVTIRSLGDALFLRGAANRKWFRTDRLLKVDKKPEALSVIQRLADSNEKSFFVRGGPHASDPVHLNAGVYRGAVSIEKQEDGSFTVTNHVGLEDYVAGILPTEMSASWELEALKAQAVASRTYALYMKARPKHSAYDLDGDTQDQVYGGAALETARVRQAIDQTQGEFLTFHDRPIKAYFHSRCGGVTETAQTVWNDRSREHRVRVVCPYCQRHPYQWETTVAKHDFLASLNLFPNPGENFRLLSARRTPTGRLASLLVGLGKRERVVSGDELRGALGYARLKSTNLNWKLDGENIVFEGKGSGHGVGMCQWGARHLAKQGKSYHEILKYFYPSAKLVK